MKSSSFSAIEKSLLYELVFNYNYEVIEVLGIVGPQVPRKAVIVSELKAMTLEINSTGQNLRSKTYQKNLELSWIMLLFPGNLPKPDLSLYRRLLRHNHRIPLHHLLN